MVLKIPRWPFDKFPAGDRGLGTQMKATGEVMAIERTVEAALNKAVRGMELGGRTLLWQDASWSDELTAWRLVENSQRPAPLGHHGSFASRRRHRQRSPAAPA